MQKRVLLLTGSPGVGKTTLLKNTAEFLKEKGYSIGGMISEEVREGTMRIGFQILDVASLRRGWLAHIGYKTGPRIGRYYVNIRDLNAVGVKAILDAIEKKDVVIIDEIGPMELFSENFRDAATKALQSHRLVLVVLHLRSKDPLVEEFRNHEEVDLTEVTTSNREKLKSEIREKALLIINKSKR